MSLVPSDIVSHLKAYLPRFTDLFTEQLTVDSAVVGVGNILTVNATAHGKSLGQYVLIKAGSVKNALITSTLINPTVQFTTEYEHDLTKPSLTNDDWTLTLGGFGNIWDGEQGIVEVPNRYNFEINLPLGEVAAPAVDGSQYLLESLPLGVYQIDTVPDLDSFTIDLSEARDLPVGDAVGLELVTGYRIAAAADVNRARDIYSEQSSGKAYLFLIMTDTDVSKDRNVSNDAIAELNRNDLMQVRLLQSFSTTVFLPTTDDVSGSGAQDLAYDEVFTALLKALFGYMIDGGMYKTACVPAGMGPGEYNSAFYTHVFDWQVPYIIYYDAGLPAEPDRAFRNMDHNHLIGGDDTENMTVENIDLDEEPIIPT